MSGDTYNQYRFPLGDVRKEDKEEKVKEKTRYEETYISGLIPTKGTQAYKVLWMLCYKAVVGQGASNYAFLEARIPRFGGRIYELRHNFNWSITKMSGERKGEWLYKLDQAQARELWAIIKEER